MAEDAHVLTVSKNALTYIVIRRLHPSLSPRYLGWAAPGLIGKWLDRIYEGGADELSRISCLGWAAWCAFDLVSTVVKLRELAGMRARVEGGGEEGEEAGWAEGAAKERALAVLARSRTALFMNVVRSLCFLIPDIQWSMKAGNTWAIQPDWFMQGLSLVECFVGYYGMWNGYSCARPTLPEKPDVPSSDAAEYLSLLKDE